MTQNNQGPFSLLKFFDPSIVVGDAPKPKKCNVILLLPGAGASQSIYIYIFIIDNYEYTFFSCSTLTIMFFLKHVTTSFDASKGRATLRLQICWALFLNLVSNIFRTGRVCLES